MPSDIIGFVWEGGEWVGIIGVKKDHEDYDLILFQTIDCYGFDDEHYGYQLSWTDYKGRSWDSLSQEDQQNWGQ